MTLEHLKGKNKYVMNHLTDILERLNDYERSKGLMQHHDAITGTSYPSTIENWKEILKNSSVPADEDIEEIAKEYVKEQYQENLDFKLCNLNVDYDCEIFSDPDEYIDNPAIFLLLYNPEDAMSGLIRLKVPHHTYEVVINKFKV